MKIPREVPVMTLPNATLFPQGSLPLYIFENRYRQMLSDVLHSTRMFAVAMQKPRTMRESPAPVAGLGVVRVAVGHRDGTSHLILQGIARVVLHEVVRYKPYRVQRIRPLQAPPCDNVTVDALVVKMRELLEERMELELPFSSGVLVPSVAPKDILKHLDSLTDPEQAADWVSCAVLPGAAERQTILETVDVETRLRRLIHFLLAEARNKRKGDGR